MTHRATARVPGVLWDGESFVAAEVGDPVAVTGGKDMR